MGDPEGSSWYQTTQSNDNRRRGCRSEYLITLAGEEGICDEREGSIVGSIVVLGTHSGKD